MMISVSLKACLDRARADFSGGTYQTNISCLRSGEQVKEEHQDAGRRRDVLYVGSLGLANAWLLSCTVFEATGACVDSKSRTLPAFAEKTALQQRFNGTDADASEQGC